MKRIIALLPFLLLSGCPSKKEFMEVGFTMEKETALLLPHLITAIRAKREQKSTLALDVFAGYAHFFYLTWQNNEYNSYRDDVSFVIVRNIRKNLTSSSSSSKILEIDLSDFSNKEKYSYGTRPSEDSFATTFIYHYSFKDSLSVLDFPCEKGVIDYSFYLSTSNNELLEINAIQHNSKAFYKITNNSFIELSETSDLIY